MDQRQPSKPLHVVMLLGTNRHGRMSEHVANYVADKLRERPLVTVELIDPRRFSFDFATHDYGTETKAAYPFYAEAIGRADALLIVTPEYNHGYPGALKMILDILYPEYRHKAAAIVGVSNGPWGGVRVVENLAPVLKELGLVVSQLALNVDRVDTAFAQNGEPTHPALLTRLDPFLTELLWLAEALRWGRNTLH